MCLIIFAAFRRLLHGLRDDGKGDVASPEKCVGLGARGDVRVGNVRARLVAAVVFRAGEGDEDGARVVLERGEELSRRAPDEMRGKGEGAQSGAGAGVDVRGGFVTLRLRRRAIAELRYHFLDRAPRDFSHRGLASKEVEDGGNNRGAASVERVELVVEMLVLPLSRYGWLELVNAGDNGGPKRAVGAADCQPWLREAEATRVVNLDGGVVRAFPLQLEPVQSQKRVHVDGRRRLILKVGCVLAIRADNDSPRLLASRPPQVFSLCAVAEHAFNPAAQMGERCLARFVRRLRAQDDRRPWLASFPVSKPLQEGNGLLQPSAHKQMILAR
mmetsp:Transcript_16060/g.52558  ORF Transcript_16060/g.52558 Transcript_16060/m.52558 type:complete len:329 (+) Transcript_16060:488-1474(+)